MTKPHLIREFRIILSDINFDYFRFGSEFSPYCSITIVLDGKKVAELCIDMVSSYSALKKAYRDLVEDGKFGGLSVEDDQALLVCSCGIAGCDGFASNLKSVGELIFFMNPQYGTLGAPEEFTTKIFPFSIYKSDFLIAIQAFEAAFVKSLKELDAVKKNTLLHDLLIVQESSTLSKVECMTLKIKMKKIWEVSIDARSKTSKRKKVNPTNIYQKTLEDLIGTNRKKKVLNEMKKLYGVLPVK